MQGGEIRDQDKIIERIEEFYTELYESELSTIIHTDQKDVPAIISSEVEAALKSTITYLLTYPLRPKWDIRPQQCFATRFCLLLRPGPHPRTAPSLSARPLLIVAMSSLAVLVSFFQVVSISVPLWGCCLGAFAEHALAILVVCV